MKPDCFLDNFGLILPLSLLLQLKPVSLSYGGHSNFGSNQCFHQYVNMQVVNFYPLEQYYHMSLEECKTRCLSMLTGPFACKALLFSYKKWFCQIYQKNTADGVFQLIPFPDTDYFEPSAKCLGGVNTTVNSSSPSTSTITQPGSTSTTTVSTTTTTITVSQMTTTTATTNPVVPPPGTQCPPGKSPKFSRLAGFMIQNVMGESITLPTEDECAGLCASNEIVLPSSKVVYCRTFDYHRRNMTCILTTEARIPQGIGFPNFEAAFTDNLKICVDEIAAMECPLMVTRVRQKIIQSAELVLMVDNPEECIKSCFEVTIEGRQCKAGMFFFEVNECVMTTMDSQTNPELFIDANPMDVVDYFELKCDRTRRARINEEKWNDVISVLKYNSTFTQKQVKPNNRMQKLNLPSSRRAHQFCPIGDCCAYSGLGGCNLGIIRYYNGFRRFCPNPC